MTDDDSNPAHRYDVFISYSRKDREFARQLQSALEAYRPPKSLGLPRRNLRVFRDEADFTGVDYQDSVSKHVAASAKLIVVCSPNARASAYVNQEIRLFAQINGAASVVPVLLSGIPNNEAAPGEKSQMAFPEGLSEILEMPLAADYRTFSAPKDKVSKGLFYGAWYTLLANLYGVSRAEIESREKKRQARSRRITAGVVASIMFALSAALVVTLFSRKEAVRQRQIAEDERDHARAAAEAERKARAGERQQRQIADERRREADRQRDIAQERAKIALSRQLASQALSHVDDAFDVATLLAVAAYRTYPTLEARTSLLSTLTSNQQVEGFLPGHVSWVRSVAFHPDGNILASGGCATRAEVFFHECENGEIRLWDLRTRLQVGSPLKEHHGWVEALAFSPDGKILASGSDDMTIILWDVGQPRPLERLRPCAHQSVCSERIYQLVFSPDGKILASAGQSGSTLWDVATWQPLGKPLFGREGVDSVSFSPDGKTLAMCSGRGAITLIDVATRKKMAQLSEDVEGFTPSEYRGVAYSPDGRMLASRRTSDGNIVFWDVSTHKLVGESLKGLSLAFHPGGAMLASSAADGTILLWDLATRRSAGEPIKGHTTSGAASLVFSPSGQTLAAFYSDGTIVVMEIAPRLRLGRTLKGHTDEVWCTAFSPDGKTLASGGLDKTVMLWNLTEPAAPGVPLVGHEKAITTLAFSPDGKVLASGSVDETIILWDVASRRRIGEPLKDHGGAVGSLAFAASGRTLLAVTLRNPYVFVWDVATRRLIRGPKGSDKGSYYYRNGSMTFSPDATTLAWPGLGDVSLWDVATGKSVSPALESSQEISVAFGPDGRFIASGSSSGSVTIWDASTHKPVGAPLIGHTDRVNSVAFSSDGRTLVSAGRDKTIVLWDLATRQPLGRPLAGHSGYISSAILSPDGRMLASGADDHRVIIWDVDPESWLDKACRVANRNLILTEWRHFVGQIPYGKFCPDSMVSGSVATE